MAPARERWSDPADLLRHLGIDDPHEIDVEAIAQYCGATVVYEPLQGCEARLLAHGDRAIITVHRTTHPHRWRFSAAHELGHWMLDRHQAAFACTQAMLNKGSAPSGGKRGGEDPEQRANRWAADLLMPEHLFTPHIAEQPLTLNAARDLTRFFSTSLIATALRMVRFSEVSCMLIWSRPNQRYKWFRRSPTMPAALWPRAQPGPQTLAHKLLRGARDNPGPTLVHWGQWVNLHDPPLYYVIEDSMLMNSGDVLTLLVWTDETPLDDLLDQQPPWTRGLAGERG